MIIQKYHQRLFNIAILHIVVISYRDWGHTLSVGTFLLLFYFQFSQMLFSVIIIGIGSVDDIAFYDHPFFSIALPS